MNQEFNSRATSLGQEGRLQRNLVGLLLLGPFAFSTRLTSGPNPNSCLKERATHECSKMEALFPAALPPGRQL
jgi:hypothetical protein